MDYKLLHTVYNEIDANLIKGKLEAEGFPVKISAVDSLGGKTGKPNTFGIYVAEANLDGASAILANSAIANHSRERNLKMLAWTIIAIILLSISAMVLSYFTQ